MGQSDNIFDLDFYPAKSGWEIVVNYWYHEKKPKKGKERRITSCVTYTWWTDCQELIQWCKRKKTKVFYSQLRVLCRQFGKREVVRY